LRLFDVLRVSTSLCRFIFESPKVNDALLFMTILSTDLKSLKRRGYNGAPFSKSRVFFGFTNMVTFSTTSRQDSAPAEGRTRSGRKSTPSIISLELGNSNAGSGYTDQDAGHGNEDSTTSDSGWFSDKVSPTSNRRQPRANPETPNVSNQ
jgi:hypothetical protein